MPKWLKPETSTNRVWIYAGQLHIIPLPNKHSPTVPACPTVKQALQITSSGSISTKANNGMQAAIGARIKDYPKKCQAEMHRARCLLPVKVAHVLHQKPQLVSAAVQTFHYRDVEDMKAAAKLARFPPEVSLLPRAPSESPIHLLFSDEVRAFVLVHAGNHRSSLQICDLQDSMNIDICSCAESGDCGCLLQSCFVCSAGPAAIPAPKGLPFATPNKPCFQSS